MHSKHQSVDVNGQENDGGYELEQRAANKIMSESEAARQ